MTFSSRHREFDYLELGWLEKTTGRQRHEWDTYILKELLDNALDADEIWSRETSEKIEISVVARYPYDEKNDIHSLEIAVTNGAPFPVELMPKILDLTQYASSKSLLNLPTRGRQGNALKTIVGISYAVKRHFYRHYDHINWPLVIETGSLRCTLRLKIDRQKQTVESDEIETAKRTKEARGTRITVSIDQFEQERPRTLTDLKTWTQRFALFNPHVTFSWQVQVGSEKQEWKFNAADEWPDVFTGAPPIHWHEFDQFREILLDAERKHGPGCAVADAVSCFAGFTPDEDLERRHARNLCARLDVSTLGNLQAASGYNLSKVYALWWSLLMHGRRIDPEALGVLGQPWLEAALSGTFEFEEPPLYKKIVPTDDTEHPCVIELLLAKLPAGNRRCIWIGCNHTPMYDDPFHTRPLMLPPPPDKPFASDTPVFGVDGFLDAYNHGVDQPTLLILHLICPNPSYQDFSKTVMDTSPFRTPLSEGLHELLTAFNTVAAPVVRDYEPIVRRAIPEAIREVSCNGKRRYAPPQLLQLTRRRLFGQGDLDEETQRWLSSNESDGQLRTYIERFLSENPDDSVLRPEYGRLLLPERPHGYTTRLLREVNERILAEACVNKILIVSDPELEEIISENGLLARFDAAMLHLEGTWEQSLDRLIPHLAHLPLVLCLLHHATASQCVMASRLQELLPQLHLEACRLVDLGLTPVHGRALGIRADTGNGAGDLLTLQRVLAEEDVAFLLDDRREMSLFWLSVDQLADWLERRFSEENIPAKAMPELHDLRTAGLAALRQEMAGKISHLILQEADAERQIDTVVQFAMQEHACDTLETTVTNALAKEPLISWRHAVAQAVSVESEIILDRHNANSERS